MELFDVTERALEVGLHGTELRQQVIANNLANVNTPGFKRSDVEFQRQLAEALQFGGAARASTSRAARWRCTSRCSRTARPSPPAPAFATTCRVWDASTSRSTGEAMR